MLHVTTLRHRSSIRTAAVATVLALLLGLGAAAPAAAAVPDDRRSDSGWSEHLGQLASLIAQWLGIGSLTGASDDGPGMDPNGLSGDGDHRPGTDSGGIETDDGPGMDPNG